MAEVPPRVRTAQARAARTLGRIDATSLEPASSGGPVARTYAGLVTRTIAFALDGALINGAAALVGVVVGLGVSLLHLPEAADIAVAAVLGALWVLWSLGYFVFFWSTTGQTPGSRVMRIQVVDRSGAEALKPRRAIVRFGALVAGAIPLFAGFLMMLFDDRRRCFQDRVARTLVIDAPRGGVGGQDRVERTVVIDAPRAGVDGPG